MSNKFRRARATVGLPDSVGINVPLAGSQRIINETPHPPQMKIPNHWKNKRGYRYSPLNVPDEQQFPTQFAKNRGQRRSANLKKERVASNTIRGCQRQQETVNTTTQSRTTNPTCSPVWRVSARHRSPAKLPFLHFVVEHFWFSIHNTLSIN